MIGDARLSEGRALALRFSLCIKEESQSELPMIAYPKP